MEEVANGGLNGPWDWWKAVEEGKVAVVIAFIKAGRDLDSQDCDGGTALYNAAYYGHVDIVKALVQAGASVDVAEEDGDTPLHISSWEGHLEVCKCLIDDGKASISRANDCGDTPLAYATTKRRKAIIAYLKFKGAK